MGITGEIVKNVFAKGRHHHHHRCHLHNTHSTAARLARAEKKRWKASVRSYLCGDHDSPITDDDNEVVSFRSSTVAEAGLDSFRSNRAAKISTSANYTWERSDIDAASVRSSEATVNQPLDGNPTDEVKQVRLQQEDAALIIQSAFRAFRVKRARDEAKTWDERRGNAGSPSKESIGTSIEVQTGNSSDIFTIKEGSFDLRHTLRHRSKAQVLRIQEDWDDSTVSSVISKMRIRKKMEAATRRERALAYAFSQQLRVCSKRKQCTPKGDEANTASWTWLERWMAARQPEMIDLIDDNITDGVKAAVCKKILDASIEEKESCGSNEVSMLFENSFPSVAPNNVPRPCKVIRTKATRSLSQQNSTSSHLCPKDAKKVQHLEDEKEKRKRARQPSLGNKKDLRNAMTTNQLPMEHGDEPSVSIN